MDFHGKKVLDKSSNWTLIGWKDSYENLKVYMLPNSDHDDMQIKIAEILSEEKDAYVFAISYRSKKKVLEIMQKKLKYALNQREKIEKKSMC